MDFLINTYDYNSWYSTSPHSTRCIDLREFDIRPPKHLCKLKK